MAGHLAVQRVVLKAVQSATDLVHKKVGHWEWMLDSHWEVSKVLLKVPRSAYNLVGLKVD